MASVNVLPSSSPPSMEALTPAPLHYAGLSVPHLPPAMESSLPSRHGVIHPSDHFFSLLLILFVIDWGPWETESEKKTSM